LARSTIPRFDLSHSKLPSASNINLLEHSQDYLLAEWVQGSLNHINEFFVSDHTITIPVE